MKKILSILLVFALLLSLSIVSIAEEEPSESEKEAQAQVEQSVNEIIRSEEEETYKKYFESAYAIVAYTRNGCVNIGNFFHIAWMSTQDISFSFLKDLNSPLELTKDQLKSLNTYKESSSNHSSYRSYTKSSLNAALHFSKNVPAYLAVFKLLEKPTVPDKYKEVDACIDGAIAEAQRFYDACIKYLDEGGKGTNYPSYDETYYDYLTIVNDAL